MTKEDLRLTLEQEFKNPFTLYTSTNKEVYYSKFVLAERMGNVIYLETVAPIPTVHYKVPYPSNPQQFIQSICAFKEEVRHLGQLMISISE